MVLEEPRRVAAVAPTGHYRCRIHFGLLDSLCPREAGGRERPTGRGDRSAEKAPPPARRTWASNTRVAVTVRSLSLSSQQPRFQIQSDTSGGEPGLG